MFGYLLLLIYFSLFIVVIFSNVAADEHHHSVTGLISQQSTGFYSRNRVSNSIVFDARYFHDPPGGVEALIQLSIAFHSALPGRNAVFVSKKVGKAIR